MKDESYDQGSYPQEITEQERQLGFQSLFLEAYGLPDETIPPLQDAQLVVKLLDSSNVIVKILYFDVISYSHKRYGTDKTLRNSQPEWWPMNNPFHDPVTAILNAQNGITNAPYVSKIIPATFSYYSKP